MSYYPPLNTPSIVHGFFEFMSSITELFIDAKQTVSTYFNNSEMILNLIDIYIYHYEKAPVNISGFVNNSRLLFKPLLV